MPEDKTALEKHSTDGGPNATDRQDRTVTLAGNVILPISVVQGTGTVSASSDAQTPEFTVKALLEYGDKTAEGILVRAAAIPWFEILAIVAKDPSAAYRIDPRRWEEIIAGAYERAGFNQVVLTPRSGDLGRDVIATKNGVGSIRIFDQVKAYRPDHVVTAEEVRAVLGVITGAQNVSKGVITTTSKFAPLLASDPYIAPHIPYRLELRPRDVLLPWLEEVSKRREQ